MRAALLLAACVVLAGCRSAVPDAAPPRVTTTPALPVASSTIRVPLAVPLDQVQAALERRVPRRLWTIDEPRDDCIPAGLVRPLGYDIQLTPAISCRITGTVDRTRLTVEGDGQDLLIRLPVTVALGAQDIGGLLAGEASRGQAEALVRARLSVTPDWRLAARVQLTHEWSRAPRIQFLGLSFDIADRADTEIAGLLAAIERELEREFARIDLAPFVANAWARGFAVMPLGGGTPPAWLRITPQRLGVAGYHFAGRELLVDFALEARTETRLGTRPRAATATVLPPQAGAIAPAGLRLVVPVTADYAALEPLVLAELRRRAAATPGVVRFDRVQLYATTGGRLAIGVTGAMGDAAARTLWLTGMPHNAPGSTQVSLRDLALVLEGSRRRDDPLAALLLSAEMHAAMEHALVRDFAAEHAAAVAGVRAALARLDTGSAALSAEIDQVSHGTIRAIGAGLFVPVQINGSGRLSVRVPQAGENP